MKTISVVLPDPTHEALVTKACLHGMEMDQYCSILLTEVAAESSDKVQDRQRSLPMPKENESVIPSRILTQDELLREIIAFLKTQKGGAAQKADVESALFEKHKGLFQQPYYSELVGGGVPRWKKNVQFARHAAKSFRLIKSPDQSGRGVWELTDLGRQWQPE
jgi:hypothetical protein